MLKLKVEEVILEAQAKRGRRITYREIHKETKIAQTTLARLRSGQARRVDLDVLNALASYLDCHPCDFFEYTPDDQPKSQASPSDDSGQVAG